MSAPLPVPPGWTSPWSPEWSIEFTGFLPVPSLPSGKILAITSSLSVSSAFRPPINVGDVGTSLLIETDGSPIGSLTFTRPDGTTFTASGQLFFTGPVNILTYAGGLRQSYYAVYVFQPGDITVAGIWKVAAVTQGKTIASGTFSVLP